MSWEMRQKKLHKFHFKMILIEKKSKKKCILKFYLRREIQNDLKDSPKDAFV